MKKLTLLLPVVIFLYFASCHQDADKEEVADNRAAKQEGKITANPNGDSELALLMREMFEEGKAMKQQLKNDEMPTSNVAFRQITSAHPTNPEETNTPEFEAFSHSYIQAMEELKNAGTVEEATRSYNLVIAACMGCHQTACPGPLPKIRKLYLK